MSDPLPPPRAKAYAAALDFLLTFEARGFEPGRWRGGDADAGVIQMPSVDYDPAVLDFLRTLSAGGWVAPFDWPSWAEDNRHLLEPGAIEEADLETLQRVLTTVVRQERFVEGALLGAFESGLIVRILRRIAGLAP